MWWLLFKDMLLHQCHCSSKSESCAGCADLNGNIKLHLLLIIISGMPSIRDSPNPPWGHNKLYLLFPMGCPAVCANNFFILKTVYCSGPFFLFSKGSMKCCEKLSRPHDSIACRIFREESFLHDLVVKDFWAPFLYSVAVFVYAQSS